jgi:phage shock protein C
MAVKRLYKVREGRMICGVCGGVAEYFTMDPNVVRILWAALALAGPAAAVYLIAAILLPNKGDAGE